MYDDDEVMGPGAGYAAASYPASSSPSFGVSGLAGGVEGLAGTAVVVDEAVATAGRSCSRSTRTSAGGPREPSVCCGTRSWGPTRRGSSDRFARNGRAQRGGSTSSRGRARPAPPRLGDRIGVDRADVEATAAAIARYVARPVRLRLDGGCEPFLIASRRGLSSEKHPFFAPLLRDLAAAGVRVRFACIP